VERYLAFEKHLSRTIFKASDQVTVEMRSGGTFRANVVQVAVGGNEVAHNLEVKVMLWQTMMTSLERARPRRVKK
jgi:DNA primase